jgi:hypothetical protein
VDLGLRTVCLFWSENIISVVVWGLFAVPIHLGGITQFRLQARRASRLEKHGVVLPRRTIRQWLGGSKTRFKRVWKSEWTLSVAQSDVYAVRFPERKAVIILSWLLSPSIIAHIIYGTITLSSLTFIGPRDAVYVILRFVLSVIVCRAILMYEIAGLRERFNSVEGGSITAPSVSRDIEVDSLIAYDPARTLPLLPRAYRYDYK